jgi:host factor-I protein
LLETNNQEQLIFKHAISTVVVGKPFHSSPHSNTTTVGTHAAPGVPVDSEN